MKRFMTRKAVVATATVALSLGIAGAAFAFFTGTGSGTGKGTVGTSTWTVSGVAYSSGPTPLYPGAADQTWDFTITNGSGGEQSLNNVTVAVTDVQKPLGTSIVGTCPVTNFNVDDGVSSDTYDGGSGNMTISGSPTVPDEIAAGNDVTGTFTLAMNDDNQTGTPVNQDPCKNAIPIVTVTAS